jgi:hypothetical protein
MMQQRLKTTVFCSQGTMSQKMSNADMSRFNLEPADATLIMAVVGFVCYLLGFLMGVFF